MRVVADEPDIRDLYNFSPDVQYAAEVRFAHLLLEALANSDYISGTALILEPANDQPVRDRWRAVVDLEIPGKPASVAGFGALPSRAAANATHQALLLVLDKELSPVE